MIDYMGQLCTLPPLHMDTEYRTLMYIILSLLLFERINYM